MILEKEQVEVVDSDQTTENNTFSPVENPTHPHSWITASSIFFIVFILIVLVLFSSFTFYNYLHSSTIAKGIYIYNVDVSGLTKEQALRTLSQTFANTLSNDITLIYNDYATYIKTSEIDIACDINSAVDYAYQYGKDSNLFVDNMHIFSAMLNGINIMPNITYDENKLKDLLGKISAELPDTVVESGYYIDGKSLIITKGKAGNVVNVDATAKDVSANLNNLNYLHEAINLQVMLKEPNPIDLDAIHAEVYSEAKDASYTTNPYVVYPSSNGVDFNISIDEAKNLLASSENECTIPLKAIYPSVTTNMIGQEAFPDKLSSFSTNYPASNGDRTTNLRLAASKINGYVLLPGETFSYNSVVGERTIAAGYKEAAIYQNGEVVNGLGGGICQISSTLYNAALFANLEMVELHNHQFVPSYVSAGRDATVVYGVKDFKFKNNRNYAIKINCSVGGGVAKFELWGLKQENEYEVSVYANVNSRTSSYIKSSTYRTLKQNGQVVKTENIINSTYKVH